MRRNILLAITLIMILAAMFFIAACTKQVMQTELAATTQPEIPKSSDKSLEGAEQAGRLQADRLQAQAPQAADGSTEEAKQAQQEDRLRAEAAAREFVNDKIHFAFDSSILSDQAQQILSIKSDYLKTNPGVVVTIEGHCDERGTDVYNMALGKRRADSVKNFFVNLGISPDRLNTISYGKERPVATGQNQATWAMNRRAQFVLN